MAHLSRRLMLALPLAAVFTPTPAHADTLLEGALDGLAASFDAAAAVTGRVAASVAAVTPAMFKPAERAAVGAQIVDFEDALSRMAISQRIIMGDIGDYIDSVRANGFSETQHTRMWRSVLGDLRELSAKVDIVEEKRRGAAWLKSALSSADEQAFGDALAARQGLLDKLLSLPAPRTTIEIDKLSALHARYTELIRQLAALRLALSQARERFA